jgi:hypothetical protein
VIAIVRAPESRAARRASTVSIVDPVCEMPIATHSASSRAAEVSAACGVRPGEGQQADPVQLLVQVLPHEAARPDAVDVDPPGSRHGVDCGGERLQVQGGGSVLYRGGIVEGNLGDDVGKRVVAVDVRREHHAVPCGLPAGLAGEGEPQLGVALETGRPAEAHDGGHRGCALLREPADRQLRGSGRVAQYGLGDPAAAPGAGTAPRRGSARGRSPPQYPRADNLLHTDRWLRKLLTSDEALWSGSRQEVWSTSRCSTTRSWRRAPRVQPHRHQDAAALLPRAAAERPPGAARQPRRATGAGGQGAGERRLVDDGRPGAVIVALVVGLNLLGDGLRDALDPRNGGPR